MVSSDQEKMIAAKEAARLVRDNMIIGLGTGSTVYFFLKELGELAKKGMNFTGIPSSKETGRIAKEFGIKTKDYLEDKIDVTFDGADEADLNGNLIKGGGGALVREKIIAYNSKKMVVMVDSSKIKAEGIGNFPLPIEVLPFLSEATLRNIEKLGAKCGFRGDGKFLSDNNNMIIDCDFGIIKEPEILENRIKMIPGVVEVGIFTSLAYTIIEGKGNEPIVHDL